jgi:hypothetical protein
VKFSINTVTQRAVNTFENHDPARWTFLDPAPPRFAAKAKLALARFKHCLCGRSAVGAGFPEKSPMRDWKDQLFKLRKAFVFAMWLALLHQEFRTCP